RSTRAASSAGSARRARTEPVGLPGSRRHPASGATPARCNCHTRGVESSTRGVEEARVNGRLVLVGAGVMLAVVVLELARPAAGFASPHCRGVAATVVGTQGSDVLIGTPGPDVVAGLGGNDVIRGRGGDDRIC